MSKMEGFRQMKALTLFSAIFAIHSVLSSGGIRIVSCVDQSFEVCADEIRCGEKYSAEIGFFEKLETLALESDGIGFKSVSYLEYNNLNTKPLLKSDLLSPSCKCAGIAPSTCFSGVDQMFSNGKKSSARNLGFLEDFFLGLEELFASKKSLDREKSAPACTVTVMFVSGNLNSYETGENGSFDRDLVVVGLDDGEPKGHLFSSEKQIAAFVKSVASNRARQVYEKTLDEAAEKTLAAIKDLCGQTVAITGCGSLSGEWGKATPAPSARVGATLAFVCAPGYAEPGEAATCVLSDSSLVWSGATECVKQLSSLCEVILAAEWGHVDYDGRTEGARLTYFCNRGYVAPADGPAVCELIAGQHTWAPATATRCQALLCPETHGVWGNGTGEPDRMPGAEMRYSCSDAYVPPDAPAVCQISSIDAKRVHWSGSAECALSPAPLCPNIKSDTVVVKSEDRGEGAVLEFACVPGYNPTPSTPVTCSVSDGSAQWKPSAAELCIKGRCNEVAAGVWGSAAGDPDDGYGAKLGYACEPGYTSPPQPAFCGVVGSGGEASAAFTVRWVGVAMCTKIENYCPGIENGVWGAADAARRKIGTAVQLRCNRGYVLPPAAAVCGTEAGKGVWSPAEGVACAKLTGCEDIVEAQWGSAEGDPGNEIDARLVFACAGGYREPTESLTICVESGGELAWSGPDNCERKANFCPPVPVGAWGNAEPNEGMLGDVLATRCNPGYAESPEGQAQCTENGGVGVWLPAGAVKCVPKVNYCPDIPTTGRWGYALTKERTIGTKVQLVCSDGHSIVGRPAICVSGDDPNAGQWKGATNCVRNCRNVTQPSGNGRGSPNNEEGSVLHFDCNPGYADRNNPSFCRYDEAKNILDWDNVFGCEDYAGFCSEIAPREGSTVDVGDRSINTALGLACADGYSKPAATAKCIPANGLGKWNPADAIYCQKDIDACPEIHGESWESIDAGDRSLGTVLRIECEGGYSVPGAPAVCTRKERASAAGAWVGAIGCAANCPAAKSAWGETTGVPDTGFGAQLKVVCAPGYESRDRTAMPMCVYDENADVLKWGRDVVCKTIKGYCPTVQTGETWGTADAGDRSLGTVLAVVCNPGHAMAADPAVCSGDREWLPIEGKKCEKIKNFCPKFDSDSYTLLGFGDGSLGTELELRCVGGYLPPEAPAVCTDNGEGLGVWLPLKGTKCVSMKGCENIANEQWGEATGVPNNSLDSHLAFVCKNGYAQPENPAVCVYGEDAIFWKGDTECPKIGAYCAELPPEPGTTHGFGKGTIGTELSVVCGPGYNRPNNEIAVCAASSPAEGSWDPAESRYCVEAICSALSGPWGNATGTPNNAQGSALSFACAENYAAPQSPARCVVQSDGSAGWTGDTRCEELLCPAVAEVPGGTASPGSRSVGAVLLFRCDALHRPPAGPVVCATTGPAPVVGPRESSLRPAARAPAEMAAAWQPAADVRCFARAQCVGAETGAATETGTEPGAGEVWGVAVSGPAPVDGSEMAVYCAYGFDKDGALTVCVDTGDEKAEWVGPTECVETTESAFKEAMVLVIIVAVITAILLVLTLLRFVPAKKAPLGGKPEEGEEFMDLDAPEYSQMTIEDTEMVL